MQRREAGFTLIEVAVVIVIIGILASVLLANFGDSNAQSRDAKRQADLRALQSAIELYKNREGRYPEGCKGPNIWSGEPGSAQECALSSEQYIEGLAPEYIATLPVDPKRDPNEPTSGYAYIVNDEGTVYKLMARYTVETENVDYGHPFQSCDASNSSIGICDAVDFNFNNKAPHCQQNDAVFDTSYAVWGGFADGATATDVEEETEDIICKM